MNKYLLCLDKTYDVNLGNDYAVKDNLMQMIDNLVYLLQKYSVDDDEILENIQSDLDIEISEVE